MNSPGLFVGRLIRLSEHRGLVFGVAGGMLFLSGVTLWRARSLPCPTDPALARTCVQLRRWSVGLWWTAAIATSMGALFAFVLPAFQV